MERRNHAERVVITETAYLVQGLASAAFKSPLMDLFNRAALRLLAREHDRGETSTGPFAVAYADLTGFKAVNQKYTHDAGDATLKTFGERLAGLARSINAYAYHLSGDEFLVLIPPDRVAEFRQQSANLHKFLVQFGDQEFSVRANFGIAMPFTDCVIEALQKRAEKACERAKTQRMQEPLVWSESQVEEEIIERRWRCDHCQATVSLLLPREHRTDQPFRCINCGDQFPD